MSNATKGAKGPRFHLAMAVSRAAASALKLARRNAGQMPGVIAEKIDPSFLADVDKPARVVFVSGTNGKTTTNNLLCALLRYNGIEMIDNREGGNVRNGVESTLIKNATISGRQKLDVAVMELDELSFRTVLPDLVPEVILVTNLYRDSFSRNANPDFIFSVMSENISPATKLILNADDMISCRLAPQNSNRVYYSIARLILRALCATSPLVLSVVASLNTTTAICAILVTHIARAAVSLTPSPITSSWRSTATLIRLPCVSAATRGSLPTHITLAITRLQTCITCFLRLWSLASLAFPPRLSHLRSSAAST